MNKDSHATFTATIYLTETLKYPLILQTWNSVTISGGFSLQEDLLPSLDPQFHPWIHSPIPALQLRAGSVGHPHPTPSAHFQAEKLLPRPPTVMSMPELTVSLFLLHYSWPFLGFGGNSPASQQWDKDEGKEEAFISHQGSSAMPWGYDAEWGHKAKKKKVKTIRNKETKHWEQYKKKLQRASCICWSFLRFTDFRVSCM